MSSKHLLGNRVIQKVGGKEAELGYIGKDKSTGSYVLWLKDHDGVFMGNRGSYVRGDEWPTLAEAKEKVLTSTSANLAHWSWMQSVDTSRLRQSIGVGYGFLAMQFNECEMEKFFLKHIKQVIPRELGYEVIDLRDISMAGNVVEIMRNTIEGSKFVIADLTHDNSGAYWESGYAEGKGIPVIYVCEREKFEREKTHFDTSHLTTVPWSMDEPERFEKELTDTIRRSLESNN